MSETTDVPDMDAEMAAVLLAEVKEHVAEIMFDAQEAADRDCVLCQRGVQLGVWTEYGYPLGPWAYQLDDEPEFAIDICGDGSRPGQCDSSSSGGRCDVCGVVKDAGAAKGQEQGE